jgi:hypothetical protein
LPLLTTLDHVGYVVPDAQAAITELLSRHEFADSREAYDVAWDNATFHGEPCSFAAHYHFISLGNTDIEVIEPRGGSSPYTEFLDSGGAGVHHLAFVVASIDEHLIATPAAAVLLDAQLPPNGRFVYVHGLLQGILVELIQPAT